MTQNSIESQAVKVFAARKILTMNPRQPVATHVAIREGRILSVGTLDETRQWTDAEPDTTFADKVLMPGLVEGHSHLMEGAMWSAVYVGYYERRGPDGTRWPGLQSLDAVIARLQEAERALDSTDAPLLAWGFDPIFFGSERLTVTQLDKVSATRPVAVLHASVHLMNVNSPMLALAGIDEDTDVDGIVKDKGGRPTGELQEFAAMFPVYRVIGPKLSISASDNPEAIRAFGKVAQLAGVTTATDLLNDLSDTGMRNLVEVTRDARFPIRLVPAFSPQRNPEGGPDRVLEAMKLNADKLRFGPVKFIVDGSIQGYTARLRWPGYVNGHANGLWLIPPEQFVETFLPYHLAGLQMHIHTNGDEATELVLDAIETILARHPRPDHRHTLQHCQMADARQLERAARLGMCVNFFSNHIYYWGDAHYAQTMGADRANRMNAAATAQSLGITFGIHSDAPITQLNPLFTAWCAVQRKTASGRVLGETECLSVPDALRAITLGAAHTIGMDDAIGSIEVGKFADFAVLDEDPHEVPAERLGQLRVWGTILGGRVFEAPA
ncbi:amidohydrolase [Caballeronia sp. LZ034LL]|uniref:amidohydrolase n=1 Tax=Caballeronia sp. LZ034LL TaxID=3038567 RepID=UPI00285CBC7F|nr:amidohydrolase [Caballeronia sp. LZ034LL]MDR5835448.1 amidohydrolase [Caballeronia sp. LZ034LL]